MLKSLDNVGRLAWATKVKNLFFRYGFGTVEQYGYPKQLEIVTTLWSILNKYLQIVQIQIGILL